MSGIINANRYRYQYVPPSQSNVVLGINGGPGDYLHRLIINVTNPGNGVVTLIDGLTVIPISVGAAQLGLGPYSVEMNMASQHGPWRITTGSGAGVIAVGQTIG